MTASFDSRLIAWLLVASACLMSATDMARAGLQYAQTPTEVLDLIEDKEVRHQKADSRRQRVQDEQGKAMAAGVVPARSPTLLVAPPPFTEPADALSAPPPLIRAPPALPPAVT